MSPSIGFFWWNTEVCCCCRGWTHLLSSFTASFSKIDRRYCLDLSNAINRLGTRNIRLARAELLNPFARADIPLQGFRKGSLTLNRMMEEASMEQQHWKKCRCPNFDTLSIRIFKWTFPWIFAPLGSPTFPKLATIDEGDDVQMLPPFIWPSDYYRPHTLCGCHVMAKQIYQKLTSQSNRRRQGSRVRTPFVSGQTPR